MQNDPATFHFGSVAGSTLSLGVFFAICVAAGIIVYLILTRPSLRRREVRRLGVVPRPVAVGIGASVFLVFFLLVYFTSINGFYTMHVESDGLHVVYVLPSRAYDLPQEHIEGVSRTPGTRTSWRLKVITRNGDQHLSANDSMEHVDLALRHVLSTLTIEPGNR